MHSYEYNPRWRRWLFAAGLVLGLAAIAVCGFFAVVGALRVVTS